MEGLLPPEVCSAVTRAIYVGNCYIFTGMERNIQLDTWIALRFLFLVQLNENKENNILLS